MSTLSTHVLDTSNGCPAEGVAVLLARHNGESWSPVGTGTTNADGRVTDLTPGTDLDGGRWRLTFGIGAYFERRSQESFYDDIDIVFHLAGDDHYHVPLLASPWGYSTYRGS